MLFSRCEPTRNRQRAGALRGQLQAQGITRSAPDMLIAATAQEHQLIIATRNVKDFVGLARYRVAPRIQIGYGRCHRLRQCPTCWGAAPDLRCALQRFAAGVVDSEKWCFVISIAISQKSRAPRIGI
jgi:hypothetical protein